MAHVNDAPSLKKLIGAPFAKVNASFMASGKFVRKLPWDDASTPKRQARQSIFIPTGITPGQNPETINYAVANKYASWGVRPGNPWTLTNYQVLRLGTTDKYDPIPPTDDLVIYGDASATNAIFIQYNIAHGNITNAYSIGTNATFLDTAILVVAEAVASWATAGYSSVIIASAQGAFEADSGLTTWGQAGLKVGEAYYSAGSSPAGTVGFDTASTASTASAGVSSAEELGSTPVADFGLDFDFSSVDFSDGESFTAFSDAENADFGWGMGSFGDFGDMSVTDVAGLEALDDSAASGWDLGTTPEPNTGFGTLPDGGDFDYGAVDANAGWSWPTSSPINGTTVAAMAGKALTPHKPTTATGAGSKYSQSATSTLSALLTGNAGSKSTGSSAQPPSGPGAMQQLETLLSKTFTGQLKPNTGNAAPVASTGGSNAILYLGIGLLAVAIFVKVK